MRIYDKNGVRKILRELLRDIESIRLGEDELILDGLEVKAEDIKFDISPRPVPEIVSPVEEKVEVEKYEPISKEWPNQIQEIPMGAGEADGGTRKKTLILGGERCLPFYPDAENPNPPAFTLDTFDSEIPLPKVISRHYEDVMGDPGEWAKKSVREYNADAVTIHLTSTDPKGADASPKEAMKTVEEVLEAVNVPLVIGGSGSPEKDPEVLAAAAEAAEGERCLLASATLDIDWKKVADSAIEFNHNVLAWTSMDVNLQKELNRRLLNYGVDRNRIIMDPTTAALGFGLEYSFTVMQRIRIAGLSGDEELEFPISNGATNAWGAREAWMGVQKSKEKYGEDWGSREFRGPLWEVFTGLSTLLSGSDLLMTLHPRAVSVLREATKRLSGGRKGPDTSEWITAA